MSDRLDISALGQEFVSDPHPWLAKIREEEPIRRVLWHGMPAWLVTRFTDVQAVYTDPRLTALKEYASPEVLAVPWAQGSKALGLGRSVVHIDPPEHTRMRKLVMKAFTSRRVESLRPFTLGVAEELADAMLAKGRVDVLSDFSVPLACRVIMALLGVAADDMEKFRNHTYVFLSTDPAERARFPEAVAWMRHYIDSLIEAKRAAPTDDLLSEMIAAREDGEALDELELASMTLLLLMAGFETTASLVGSGLLLLLRHPEQMAALRNDLSLVPRAVEEMLRYEGAALASMPKFAKEDLNFCGVDVKAGEALIASWPAANRDPRRFTDPDSFDVHRSEATHVGFAHGPHFCIGAALARMETQVAFETLLTRFATIELAVPVEDLQWRVTPNVRGLRALPITVS